MITFLCISPVAAYGLPLRTCLEQQVNETRERCKKLLDQVKARRREMQDAGITTLVSFDKGFDTISFITREEPEAEPVA